MNNTFYGHAPNVTGLLNLDRGDTNIRNIDAKRCKVDNDSATYLWYCHLGHIGVKRMKLGFWNHLIMNHLVLAYHTSWTK